MILSTWKLPVGREADGQLAPCPHCCHQRLVGVYLEEAQSGSVWHVAVSDSGSWPLRLVTCLSLYPPNTVLLVIGLGSWISYCSLACCLLLNVAISYRERCSPGHQRASPTTSAPSPSCPTRLSLVSGDCLPAAPASGFGCCVPSGLSGPVWDTVSTVFSLAGTSMALISHRVSEASLPGLHAPRTRAHLPGHSDGHSESHWDVPISGLPKSERLAQISDLLRL